MVIKMLKELSNKITKKLVDINIIEEADSELYEYGFWQGGVLFFNFLTVIFLGILSNMLLESIIFLVFYGTLRTIAGGYHARTQHTCYILSILLMIVVLTILKIFPVNIIVCCILTILSISVIFILAPVQDENKLLDETEKIVFKKLSRVISISYGFIIFLLFLFNKNELAYCIVISLFTLTIMLMLGKIRNKSRNIM